MILGRMQLSMMNVSNCPSISPWLPWKQVSILSRSGGELSAVGVRRRRLQSTSNSAPLELCSASAASNNIRIIPMERIEQTSLAIASKHRHDWVVRELEACVRIAYV
jgi:hypothetical protein